MLNDSSDSGNDCSDDEPATKRGRKAESPIWDYFTKKIQQNVLVCRVKNSKGVKCGHRINGFYATTLADHLRRKHREYFTEYEEKVKRKIAEKEKQNRNIADKNVGSSRQSKIDEPFPKKCIKFESTNPKQKRFDIKLAVMFASLNVPLNLVDKEEFVELLEEANERLLLPGRFKLTKNIADLLQKMKNGINEALLEPRKISICADIWSRRSFASSYLAITAHYYSSKDHCLRKILLGLRGVEGSHTAENIHDIICALLDEYEIPDSKISRILTDNGANMIKSFKDSKEELKMAEIAALTGEQELSESEVSAPWLPVDLNPEISFEEDEIEQLDPAIQFDQNEEQFLNQFGRNLRLSCSTHSVQRVLVDTVEKAPDWKNLMDKIRSIVRKFPKSTTATQNLMKTAGLALVKPSNTRWNIMYYVAQRLLQVKADVIKVCEDQNWDCLLASEWNKVYKLSLICCVYVCL